VIPETENETIKAGRLGYDNQIDHPKRLYIAYASVLE
jgi:hypothetical protein